MKQSLSLKIILIIILFSLGLFTFISLDNIYSRRKDLMPLFIKRAQPTAYSIEASIGDENKLRDKNNLFSLIQKNMWLDQDIVNININLADGNNLITYISNNPQAVNSLADSKNIQSFHNDIFINEESVVNNSDVLRAIAPIHVSGKILGTIQIDLDLKEINATIYKTIIEAMLVYIIVFVIFILTIFLVLKLIIINPIGDINRAVAAIKNRDFKYKIKVRSKDEIGLLGEAFNIMATDLEKSHLELENYNQKLKQQVVDQTKNLEVAKNKLETINLDLEQKIKTRTAELEKLKSSQEELIKQRTSELDQKIKEMEKLNKFMINRENKMIELKKQLQELKNTDKA